MKILVTGGSGKLGGYVADEPGHELVLLSQASGPDLQDTAALAACLDHHRPDAVLHLAAYSDVNQCFDRPDLAEAINHRATAELARLCHERGGYLLSVSTDMVFDGEEAPYAESAPPTPVSVYGQSKARGETAVLAYPEFAVVRVALMAGPTLTVRRSFFDFLLEQLRAATPLRLFEDEFRAVLSLRVAARSLLRLCELRPSGILHLAGERQSRWEMGVLTARALGLPGDSLAPGRRSEFTGREPRQRDLTLICPRLRELWPDWSPGDLTQEIRDMMERKGSLVG